MMFCAAENVLEIPSTWSTTRQLSLIWLTSTLVPKNKYHNSRSHGNPAHESKPFSCRAGVSVMCWMVKCNSLVTLLWTPEDFISENIPRQEEVSLDHRTQKTELLMWSRVQSRTRSSLSLCDPSSGPTILAGCLTPISPWNSLSRSHWRLEYVWNRWVVSLA